MNDTRFRLLVIEDNPQDVELLTAALKRVSLDHRLIHLSDGGEALDFIGRAGKYTDAPNADLVLLDIGLPKASGIDVLRAIRESDRLRNVPVIIMSALPPRANRTPLEELGAEMFWSKPMDQNGFDDLADNISAIAAGFVADSSKG